jgi:hypothetical protein
MRPEGPEPAPLAAPPAPDDPSPAILALAEAWASIDGKLDLFRHEYDAAPDCGDHDNPDDTRTFDGYVIEAQELLARLRMRGFTIVPLTTSADAEAERR